MELEEKIKQYSERRKQYLSIFNNVFKSTETQIYNISSIVIQDNEIFDELLDNILYLSSEILWLIKGGYSEGAFARFRLLYEFIVKFEIMYFDENREELINRYILNNSLIDLKNANFDKESDEYKELISEIREKATEEGLGKEFHQLLQKRFIDRNWWFEIACNKNCANIGFSDFEKKITEIKNQLMNTNFKSDNIIYKYTSSKVHGYNIDELKKFHRIFSVGKEMDNTLYLDDIIDILEIFNVELAEFIGFIFFEEDFCDKILDNAEKILSEIYTLKKKYCKENQSE